MHFTLSMERQRWAPAALSEARRSNKVPLLVSYTSSDDEDDIGIASKNIKSGAAERVKEEDTMTESGFSSTNMDTPPFRVKRKLEWTSLGFPEQLVDKAKDACGDSDPNEMLNHILALQHAEELEKNVMRERESAQVEDFQGDASSKLQGMGYSAEAVEAALKIFGNVVNDVVIDYLSAHGTEDLKSLNNAHASGLRRDLSEMGFSPSVISDALKSCGPEASMPTLVHYIFQQNPDILAKDTRESSLLSRLRVMGYSTEQIEHALRVCGDADEDVLVDFMFAHAEAKEEEIEDLDQFQRDWEESQNPQMEVESHAFHMQPNRRTTKRSKRLQKTWTPVPFPRGNMTGYGVPGTPLIPRNLPPSSHPYFYFENVENMPAGEWHNISRFLDGIAPEFVDSKYFCAAGRRRGYIHNLPVLGRRLILPQPPMTIRELAPEKVRYIPPWDLRTKFQCISTRSAWGEKCKEIANLVKDGVPNEYTQGEIMGDLKRWNLLWTADGHVSPLTPKEIEAVLGFDDDHTRCGLNPSDRLEVLGNAFQVNTVAWHLSVLKPLFPNGIRVLSLFSGIGGAEVALHKLGIPLKYVVSVDINKNCAAIIQCWWSRTGQRGTHKMLKDVRDLSRDVLEKLVAEAGGFDLIIGGSPCNNLSGNNRVSRDGLAGRESCLFYEFPRILCTLRQIMGGR